MKTVSESELKIRGIEIKKAAMVIKAIKHPLRQQIMRLLYANRKMIVSDLYRKLGLEQSVASQHLAILRSAGFVHTQREGKFIYYSVNLERLREIQISASNLLGLEKL